MARYSEATRIEMLEKGYVPVSFLCENLGLTRPEVAEILHRGLMKTQTVSSVLFVGWRGFVFTLSLPSKENLPCVKKISREALNLAGRKVYTCEGRHLPFGRK